MKFLEFQMVVAQIFLNKFDVLYEDAHVADADAKISRVIPVPHILVCFSASHLPEVVALKETHALQRTRLLWKVSCAMHDMQYVPLPAN